MKTRLLFDLLFRKVHVHVEGLTILLPPSGSMFLSPFMNIPLRAVNFDTVMSIKWDWLSGPDALDRLRESRKQETGLLDRAR